MELTTQKMITKANGTKEEFQREKIEKAIHAAFLACAYPDNKTSRKRSKRLASYVSDTAENIENIQDAVETILMSHHYYDVAKAYIIYREKHKESRLVRDKINYIIGYSKSTGNAASNSNTDANANSSTKNVASIEPEVFKDNIRLIQRQMMKDKLNEIYPEVAKQYIKDIESKIIYPNDESNSPIQKAYCGAYSTYPLITDGCGGLDGVTPSAPNDIQSYSGQVTNAVFALSAQTKGAVALGDYIISLNMMVVEEFGPNWYDKLDVTICNSNVKDWQKRTIKREIRKGMKQFIFGVNQPQGNRGFQSPY